MPDPGWWGHVSSLLPALTTLAAIIAAILAWAAKLRWSKEFAAAKDEIIKSKDAEIASLKTQISNVGSAKDDALKAKDAHIGVLEREIKGLQELNPTKLREYVQSIKQGLEEYNDILKQKVEEKDRAIVELELKGQSHLIAFTQLAEEKENLESQMVQLREQIGQIPGEFISLLSENTDVASSVLAILRRIVNPARHIEIRSFATEISSYTYPRLGVLHASPQDEDSSLKDS
jgi:hypothetical protein